MHALRIGNGRSSVSNVFKLIKRSFNDSDRNAKATEHCLTASFPPAPSDSQWENHLKSFYFKVVKPLVLRHRCFGCPPNMVRLMDLYELRSKSGDFLPWMTSFENLVRIISILSSVHVRTWRLAIDLDPENFFVSTLLVGLSVWTFFGACLNPWMAPCVRTIDENESCWFREEKTLEWKA